MNLVICPVYNEAKTLKRFYEKLRFFYPGDVLFVDDGSDDASSKELTGLRKSNVFIIAHKKRKGYGAALKTGFRFAIDNRYENIVVIDVDLQHNPQHIPIFFRELSEYDVVLGSRYFRIDSCMDVPRDRMIINRYITSLINMFFLIKITDPFCGYRGYGIEFLKKAKLSEDSYGFGIEIILELARTATTFKEIPVEIIYIDKTRKFLDNLNDPRKRLLYYLDVMARKRREIAHEKGKIFNSQPASG